MEGVLLKLYELVDMELEGDLEWDDYAEHWYCEYCPRITHIYVKSKTSSDICQECGNPMVEITGEMIEKSKLVKDQGCLKFTDEEVKEIWQGYHKHIKNIPTQDNLYMKDYMKKSRAKKAHQTLASANI